MDALRGTAIVLVLVWHAASIPALFGQSIPTWLLVANDFLQPFRMPTLMFLSGTLLQRSLGEPLGRYFYGKFSGIIWPYIVWNLFQIWFYGTEWSIFRPGAWVASGYLWFLFFLAGYYGLAPVLRRLPAGLVPATALVLSIIVSTGYWQQFCYFAVFFFMGDLSTRFRSKFERVLETSWLIWCATAAGLALGITAAIVDVEYNGWLAPVALIGILAVIAWGRKLDEAHPSMIIRRVGRNSLVFYTAHFAIMTAAYVGLRAIGATAPALTFPVMLVLGAGLCFLLLRYRHHPPVSWLFQAPKLPAKATREVTVAKGP